MFGVEACAMFIFVNGVKDSVGNIFRVVRLFSFNISLFQELVKVSICLVGI